MSDVKVNSLGGFQYQGPKAVRAMNFDLITLPQLVDGTNCGNCMFMDRVAKFCTHAQIGMPVTERMCCNLWKNLGQKESWR